MTAPNVPFIAGWEDAFLEFVWAALDDLLGEGCSKCPSCGASRADDQLKIVHIPGCRLRAVLDRLDEHPRPLSLFCPECGDMHLDFGEYAWGGRFPHATHQCQGCGNLWRPHPYATVGV